MFAVDKPQVFEGVGKGEGYCGGHLLYKNMIVGISGFDNLSRLLFKIKNKAGTKSRARVRILCLIRHFEPARYHVIVSNEYRAPGQVLHFD